MGNARYVVAVLVLALLNLAPVLCMGVPAPSAGAAAPLQLRQVVDNLIRRNQERAQSFQHSECTRVYRLVYRGFPGEREAEMVVKATYDSPSTKTFRVISETGSKLIQERVFKRLLDSEKEATQPAINAQTQLNRENYDFQLIAYEPTSTGGQYVLQVVPKSKSKYVYRGKVWVDGTDFAVTRIEAEPALNPSFWTKKSEIHHEYKKIQNFWLPVRNESVSYIRLGGRAILTIEYSNYHVIEAHGIKPESNRTP